MNANRHAAQSAATRATLLAIGRKLFSRRGFDAVAAEEIVREAGLTRGALYHNFDGKQGLFEAVHESLLREIGDHAEHAADEAIEAWDAVVAGCLALLDACAQADVQRIVLLDGPAVLGWERWREADARHGLGLLKNLLSDALEDGKLPPQPVDPLAHLLSGAINETVLWIARSPDPKRARREAGAALERVLEGIRKQSAD